MKLKNLPTVKKYKKGLGRGRYQDSNNWTTGPCPIRRDKYYGWLKHRAQARYRNEYYDLEFEQFESLWKDNENWFNRGKTATNLCMSLIDYAQGWTFNNIEVITRLEQLRKPKKNAES